MLCLCSALSEVDSLVFLLGLQLCFPSGICMCFFFWRFDPIPGHGFPLGAFTIRLRHTTVGRTPLDEWLAGRRDLYLTTHNTHKTQTSMPPARFEPPILASERPHTDALDRAATGIGDVGVAVCYSKSRVLNLIVSVRKAHAGDLTTFSVLSATDGFCASDSDT
jgi:hypothetical protein